MQHAVDWTQQYPEPKAKESVKLTSRLVMPAGWRMEEDWKPGSCRACALRPEGWGQGWRLEGRGGRGRGGGSSSCGCGRRSVPGRVLVPLVPLVPPVPLQTAGRARSLRRRRTRRMRSRPGRCSGAQAATWPAMRTGGLKGPGPGTQLVWEVGHHSTSSAGGGEE